MPAASPVVQVRSYRLCAGFGGWSSRARHKIQAVPSSKNAVAVAFLCILSIAAWFAWVSEAQSEKAQEEFRQEFALKQLHQTDLRALYDQINADSFAGQLPTSTYVPVSWEDLRSNIYCGNCGGMTDFDSGTPAIRINTARVRSEKGLRQTMKHEMCHVSVYEAAVKIGDAAFREMDAAPHGPSWQECMKRFE
jgi:hypothetical protein